MFNTKESNILLLPPGCFSSSFYDFYIAKYKGSLWDLNINVLDLPSREVVSENSILDDGKYIAEFINKSDKEWIVLGMSTSAAALIESLQFMESEKITSLCLVFSGEFVKPGKKKFARLFLNIIESNQVFRNMFMKYLRKEYEPYEREGSLDPRILLSFYKSTLSWRFPRIECDYPTLIIHAVKDDFIDPVSRGKLEQSFINAKIVMLDCVHEPTDKVAELVFKTLLEEKSYLACIVGVNL